MGGWNIADVVEMVASAVPDSPALIQGDRHLSWSEFDTRTNQIAAYLVESGLRRQDKVVQYLRNCPQYLESFFGALKVAMVPVNTNYRYGADELTYLWQDCEARAVVFAGSFTATIEKMRAQVPDVKLWLWVDDGEGECPAWATAYEAIAAGGRPAPKPPIRRDGDDLVLLYTGGTTGMPKGVMWRQDDLMVLLGNAANARYPDQPDLDYARSRVAAHGRRHLPAAPLMHGAGCLTCLPFMARGGAVVLLADPSFRAHELLDAIEREQVFSVGWVGDAFAKPVLRALDENPGGWKLDSWKVITSGGVLFSDEVKAGLLRHLPGLTIADVYGSSEAIAAARSVATSDRQDTPTRSFAAGAGLVVLADDDTEVAPGSGEVGRVANTGRLPLGYYRDQTKSAATFRTINGQRYSMTGDLARVEADGRISLLGRGSSCINTGGEKVFPEEVEEVLLRHPSVFDVAVLGIPDDRFGERIAAAVQVTPGHEFDAAALQEHVRDRLAGYKVPRHLVAVPDIPRGPNGKQDVGLIRDIVLRSVVEG